MDSDQEPRRNQRSLRAASTSHAPSAAHIARGRENDSRRHGPDSCSQNGRPAPFHRFKRHRRTGKGRLLKDVVQELVWCPRNSQQKFAVIPAKLAIASASRIQEIQVNLDYRFRGNDERKTLTYS